MTAAQIPGVVLPRCLLDGSRAELDAAAKDRAELLADDGPDLREGGWPNIEVAVTGIDQDILHRQLEGSHLRWVLSVSAGFEHLPAASTAGRGVLLTNSAGVDANAAEYALGVLTWRNVLRAFAGIRVERSRAPERWAAERTRER